jgi:hypothetical protein
MLGLFFSCVGVFIGYHWGWVKGVEDGESYSIQSFYGKSES